MYGDTQIQQYMKCQGTFLKDCLVGSEVFALLENIEEMFPCYTDSYRVINEDILKISRK